MKQRVHEPLAETLRGPGSRWGPPAGPVLKRVRFPVPNRDGLPGLEKYARLERDGARTLVGYVEASRGCLHMCLHCPIPPVYGGRFFVVPRGIVLADIRRLVRSGARHITFGDPDFLNGPGHSLGIVRAMHEEFPALSFDCTAKVEHILDRRVIFPELAALGCVFMVSAVESLSDTVLANLEKGHTRADVLAALEIVRATGIAFRPTWVAFTPWTTLDDYLDVLEFVEAEGPIDHVDPVPETLEQHGHRSAVSDERARSDGEQGEDSQMRVKVQSLLETAINPAVAGHGQMGGGCQGCGMADVTLKQGIETMIREELSEVVDIIDVTDHAAGENPYSGASKK